MSKTVGYRRLLVSRTLVEQFLHDGNCCVEALNTPKDLRVVAVGMSDDGSVFDLLVASAAFPETPDPGDSGIFEANFASIECRRLAEPDEDVPAGIKRPTYHVEIGDDVLPGCLGYRKNFEKTIAENLLAYLDDVEDGEELTIRIRRMDLTPEELEVLPDL